MKDDVRLGAGRRKFGDTAGESERASRSGRSQRHNVRVMTSRVLAGSIPVVACIVAWFSAATAQASG